MRLHSKLRFSFSFRVMVVLFGISIISLLPRWLHIRICDTHKIVSLRFIDESNQNQSKHTEKQLCSRYIHIERTLKDLLDQEKGTRCTVPNIDPFSKEYIEFYTDVPAITCDGDDWVECNFSQCYVKKTILDRISNVSCKYRDIVYVNDDTYYLGNPVKVKSDGKYTLNISDYVRVSCSGLHSRSKWWLSGWQGRKAGYRLLPTLVSRPTSLNVLVLIIDSVSRNAFIRRMPISYGVLKGELQAIVMNSYNIVGDGTVEALWPILTGHNQLELSDSTRRPGNTKRVDPKPFIFTLLNEYGYRTAFFEDMPWTGTFNYLYNGFEHMPADHYMRHLTKDIGIYAKQVWSTNEQHCFGSESNFKFIVEHSAKLFDINNTKKFCVTVTASYSHEDINTLTLADNDLSIFLRKFRRDGHMKDTILFVMGDHGPRISGIRNTYVGRIDAHLPFVSIVLPERLKAARLDALANLKGNSDVLTTPFDIHTTILDALELKKHRNKYKVPGADLERGMSLLEYIPKTRGCAEAGIIPHFCVCTRIWQSVSTEDIVYTKVTQKLASFVNIVTAQQRQKCAKRNLISVEWVRRHGSKYYQAKVIMDPGKAIFEGSLVYNANKDSFSVSDRDVSRVDRYGNEPNCIILTHPNLSKYCYCIVQ